ncbi:hypothetical protein [Algibacter sp. L4_22]|uniref:hypothetical protein n=1 Tax=Algibacter sp. L4_22 TaxID=2942477 RepID=UPI00201B8539|nr:hypothetical protein [Algibacter sp. L4_22]MCL5128100.1 hypothetical protein [Algibacter sp. L4_22]
MKNLLHYFQSQFTLTEEDTRFVQHCFICKHVTAQTKLLEAGKVERYVYFLSEDIVKGYIKPTVKWANANYNLE